MTINTYTVFFTSGAIMEYTLPKLTSKQYHAILQELCFTADLTDRQRHEHARIYKGNTIIAVLDYFPWIDGSADIYLDGRRVRNLYRKESVCLF